MCAPTVVIRCDWLVVYWLFVLYDPFYGPSLLDDAVVLAKDGDHAPLVCHEPLAVVGDVVHNHHIFRGVEVNVIVQDPVEHRVVVHVLVEEVGVDIVERTAVLLAEAAVLFDFAPDVVVSAFENLAMGLGFVAQIALAAVEVERKDNHHNAKRHGNEHHK